MPINRGWFRVYDRHLDSSKILELSMAERGFLMGIWTIASAKDGVIELSPLQLKRRLWMDEWTVEQVQDAITKLKALDLLEDVEGGFAPSRWKWHQSSQSLRPKPSAWNDLRLFVFERDHYTCQYCGQRGGSLECDHIYPVARGGANDISNLCTACQDCNRSKGAKMPDDWIKTRSAEQRND